MIKYDAEDIYEHITHKMEQYKTLPIFDYIENNDTDIKTKMRPIALFMLPMLTGFSDFQKFLQNKAQSESFYDNIQKKFISHSNDELNHFTFLLNDLNVLDLNVKLLFTDFIKIFMSEEISSSRQFWLNFVDLFNELNSLEKQASMEVSEKMAFHFFLFTTEKIKLDNNHLEYFGQKHLDAESSHEKINGSQDLDFLDGITLKNSDYHSLIHAIDKTCNYFFEWMDGMYKYCISNQDSSAENFSYIESIYNSNDHI